MKKPEIDRHPALKACCKWLGPSACGASDVTAPPPTSAPGISLPLSHGPLLLFRWAWATACSMVRASATTTESRKVCLQGEAGRAGWANTISAPERGTDGLQCIGGAAHPALRKPRARDPPSHQRKASPTCRRAGAGGGSAGRGCLAARDRPRC